MRTMDGLTRCGALAGALLLTVASDAAVGQVVVGDVDGDGTDDVVVTGTKGKDHFVVLDRPGNPDVVVSLDRNGDGDFLDAGELDAQVFAPSTAAFGIVRIATGKGNDTVDVTLEGTLAVPRVLAIELGSGANAFAISGMPGAQVVGGGLTIDVTGSSKSDVVEFDFAAIACDDASIALRFAGGSGVDDLTVDLGALAGATIVDLDADLGKKNDVALLRKSGTWSEGATVSLALEGNAGNDEVRCELTDGLLDDAQLELRVSLSSGNDVFETFVDAATFDVTSATESARVRLRGIGGSGRDSLILNTALTVGTIALQGAIDVDFRGESEDDTLTFDLDAPQALGFGAGGDALLRLRLDGGAGNDLIHTNLSNDASGVPAYDVELRGDAGTDQLTYGAQNATPGGNTAANYPPRGAMFIDGGEGEDGGFAFGNAFGVDVIRVP